MRVFASVTPDQLATLWCSGRLAVSEVVPLDAAVDLDSDEVDELAEAALVSAAGARGGCRTIVIAVDVDPAGVGRRGVGGVAPLNTDVALGAVAALFVGEDDRRDSGLLWYASQEIPAVYEQITGRTLDPLPSAPAPTPRGVRHGAAPSRARSREGDA